jgi:hypothetical protein
MPFVLIVIGIVLLVTAIQGTTSQLGTMLSQDIFGGGTTTGSFVFWIVAIVGIGAVGYVPRLKPFSDAFLILVIIVLFLANGGVFAKIGPALQGISSASTNAGTGGGAASTVSPGSAIPPLTSLLPPMNNAPAQQAPEYGGGAGVGNNLLPSGPSVEFPTVPEDQMVW